MQNAAAATHDYYIHICVQCNSGPISGHRNPIEQLLIYTHDIRDRTWTRVDQIMIDILSFVGTILCQQ